MIKTQDKLIDGQKVEVTQLPARRGLKLKLKITRLVGPALGKLIGAKGQTESFLDSDIDISEMLEKLFENVDEETLMNLIQEILVTTRVDGQEVAKDEVFDMVFADGYALMYKVVWYTLEVNFKSFLELMGIGKANSKGQTQTQKKRNKG